MGYHRAGFDEIVGVDIKPMPRYPFRFVQVDAFEYLLNHGQEFDAVHASPPCQHYAPSTRWRGTATDHPDLLPMTRSQLHECRIPGRRHQGVGWSGDFSC